MIYYVSLAHRNTFTHPSLDVKHWTHTHNARRWHMFCHTNATPSKRKNTIKQSLDSNNDNRFISICLHILNVYFLFQHIVSSSEWYLFHCLRTFTIIKLLLFCPTLFAFIGPILARKTEKNIMKWTSCSERTMTATRCWVPPREKCDWMWGVKMKFATGD